MCYFLLMQAHLRQGSLTEGDEDVLVNASNTRLALGSGVSAAIRRACGADYQSYLTAELSRRAQGDLAQGDAILTHAGAHPRAKAVVHVAVMDYTEGFSARSFPSLAVVARGAKRTWELAETVDLPQVRVAMVALGAGTGGLGVADSTRVACETLREHLDRHAASRIAGVTFYGFTLVEHVAMAHVVGSFFPEALADLDPDARALVSSMGP